MHSSKCLNLIGPFHGQDLGRPINRPKSIQDRHPSLILQRDLNITAMKMQVKKNIKRDLMLDHHLLSGPDPCPNIILDLGPNLLQDVLGKIDLVLTQGHQTGMRNPNKYPGPDQFLQRIDGM